MAYLRSLSVMLALLAGALPALAAGSLPHSNERISAWLFTAEDGIAPDASTISAALRVDLADGWKTYWKSPGAVGYPPEIIWSASENVAEANIFWPAPMRFDAFDIENYGYETSVTYPIQIALQNPGAPASLVAEINLLVCSEICVPEMFQLAVDLPSGDGIDAVSAQEIAAAVAKVPGSLKEAQFTDAAYWISPENDRLEVSLTSDTPIGADLTIFPDMGSDASFGPPDITFQNGAREAVVSLPILTMPEALEPFDITLVTTNRSAVFDAGAPASAPLAPTQAAQTSLIWILGIALLGGLILNVMPCVLPVLSIKLTSAIQSQSHSPARIRAGFLASAAGVLAFMWALALILIAVSLAGGQVGWGIQFQSPLFLAVMLTIITLFAANMMGLFEINLPQGLMTQLADADGRPGLAGDFATGALAAILATPCSAPFLGTAVTFALAGSPLDTLLVFTALGIGLAAPYLLVALKPSLISKLPKPGRWMLWVKFALGLLLAGTALWLVFVLSNVAGTFAAILSLAAILLALIFLRPLATRNFARSGLLASIIAAIALPALLQSAAPAEADARSDIWREWQMSAITGHVVEGKAVFVDVTADWCLTCKTNKALVLDRSPIAEILASDGVVAMQADWTRPDPEILAYLQDNGRFGIPFNMVYGPHAPQGIALPEILTTSAVTEALNEAVGVQQ